MAVPSEPVQSGPSAAPPPKRTSAELLNLMETRMAAAIASAHDISSFINWSKQERVSNTLALLGLPASPSTSSESRQASGSLTDGAAVAASGTSAARAPNAAATATNSAGAATGAAAAAAAAATSGRPLVKVEPGTGTAAVAKEQAARGANLARTLGQDRQQTAAQKVFNVKARTISKNPRPARSDVAVSAAVRRTVAAELAAAAAELAALGVDVVVAEEFGLPVVVATALHAPVPAPRVRLRVSRDYPRGGASYALEYLPSFLGKELVRLIDARIAQCRTRHSGPGVGVAATLKAWAAATQVWADAQVAVPAVGAVRPAADAEAV
eukprot:TRINITY_DN1826_c0_g1_i9.p1 TRINITY_DN1826_c0_g1~~TRINITY_DN1826_c0_g1_i9.p1  ORF type:complete len:326 (-),score=55.06 TRINITY_DN1826_c0_g1_i9:388-1365(-)